MVEDGGMGGTPDYEATSRWWLKPHPIVIGVAVWLVLGSLATLAIWGFRSGDRSLGTRLRDHGVTTLGTVTGTDAADHNTVFYGYVVSGRTYQSGYFGDGPEGDASRLSVGERIRVVYDSQDPTASCYCNCRFSLSRQIGGEQLSAACSSPQSSRS